MSDLNGTVALVTGSSEGPEFHADLVGQRFDPDHVTAAYGAGASLSKIEARAIAGEFSRKVTPVQMPEVKA